MTIQSLGVGSGLALDDLVTQLLQAERKPKEDRLNARDDKNEAEISALGQIKSKLSDFKDAVDKLRSDNDINGREPTISHPSEDNEVFTAEASNSALRGSYDIAVTELASGSRVTTADAAYSSPTDSVLSSGSGSITFKIASTGDSFSVNVTAGMTLTQLREKINANTNNFGISANIIDTGTATGGAKLVFSSDITGAGNDLSVVNDNDIAELNTLTTESSSGVATGLAVTAATNAKATIDGISVESDTNDFENTIQNVSFTATEVSPKDSLGDFITSKLTIGYDREGLKKKLNEFIDNYNSVMDEIKTLTKYGQSDLEDDGPLAGDSLLRGIQSSLASIVGSNVSASKLGGLFQLGVEMDSDGKLEIGETDFGLGSGQERLDAALDDNFDEIAKLFTDDNQGIAVRLYEVTKQYTSYSGLIALRENAAKDNRDEIADERERLELRMSTYEQILRDKYLNLDQTVSKLNSTGNALLAALG